MFTWIFAGIDRRGDKKRGKKKKKDKMFLCYRREEKKIQGLSGRISFCLISIDPEPSNLQAEMSTLMRLHWQLRCPLSKAVDGSWEEVTDKLEVNRPTAAWMLELLDDIFVHFIHIH